MLRVSRRGALVFENRDSFLLNVAKTLGYTVDYELEAVTANQFVAGGAGNGPIPNFVYRWTEKEVIKTVKSAYPAHPAHVEFFFIACVFLTTGWMGHLAQFRKRFCGYLGRFWSAL